ncbi:tetraspanin-6-like [Varanus komodoensis]|uniref:tetraspanin-6-like n=1 Tax=Varanus komodoensis TaxID=61221 RepID=UPI001CF7B7FB|nr:tetraspanin-6-like [Varanus komodoensis]
MMGKEVANWESFVKISLWLAILLYWISGIVLTCIGVSIQVKLHDTFTVLDDAASGVPVIITVVGMLIILVSTIGAVALLKCNPKMIKWFIGLLLIQLIIEIALGMAACTYREKVHQTLLKDVLKTLEKYNGELQITKGVDSLQTQFQCCGAQNYTDWLNTTFGSLSSSVPRSCCKVPVESCVTDLSKDTLGINKKGCVLKLKNWVEEHITIFGGIAMFVGLAQLTGILFCYLLLKLLKENYTSIE